MIFKPNQIVRYILKNNQLPYGSVHVVENTYSNGKFCKLERLPNCDWWNGAFEEAVKESAKLGGVKSTVSEYWQNLKETFSHGITRNYDELFLVFKEGLDLGLELQHHHLIKKLKGLQTARQYELNVSKDRKRKLDEIESFIRDYYMDSYSDEVIEIKLKVMNVIRDF